MSISDIDSCPEFVPMVGSDWKPSQGQNHQLDGMIREAQQAWRQGSAALAAQKFEQVSLWMPQQVGVFHEG